MSKKSKKQDTAPKPKAIKLPKTVAGVTVPKDLRKSGAALLAAANSPVGREVIAAGVTAVIAAVAARSQAGRKVTAEVADAVADTGAKAADTGAQQAGQIADAITTAASVVMQRLFEKKSA